MERRKPNVLVIRESVQHSSLLTWLDQRGCEYSFATSCQEAFQILRNREFDVVLSPTRVRDGSLYPIMSLLEGSDTTVFYFYSVEYGSWWLPALRRGRKCFGSPAFRGREFVVVLDEVMTQIQQNPLATAEIQPLLILPTPVSVVPPPTPTIVRAEGLELVKRKAAG
jgi:PleD family two-component response regulator